MTFSLIQAQNLPQITIIIRSRKRLRFELYNASCSIKNCQAITHTTKTSNITGNRLFRATLISQQTQTTITKRTKPKNRFKRGKLAEQICLIEPASLKRRFRAIICAVLQILPILFKIQMKIWTTKKKRRYIFNFKNTKRMIHLIKTTLWSMWTQLYNLTLMRDLYWVKDNNIK